jgi:hypothetical protein
VIAPSIAKPTMKLSAQHTENTPLRNRRSGSTGSAARDSTYTNTISETTDRPARPRIWAEIHG